MNELRVVDRWGNGMYVAEWQGTPEMVAGGQYLINNKKYGAGYSEKESGGPEHGIQPAGPYLFGLGSMICAGQHPDHGAVAVHIPLEKNVEKGVLEASVYFNGEPYWLRFHKYQGWRFEPRKFTKAEAFDRYLDADDPRVEQEAKK